MQNCNAWAIDLIEHSEEIEVLQLSLFNFGGGGGGCKNKLNARPSLYLFECVFLQFIDSNPLIYSRFLICTCQTLKTNLGAFLSRQVVS